MAIISNSSKDVLGAFTPVKTTLSASDVLTFVAGANQELIMFNTTVSPVVLTFAGANSSTVLVTGAGALTASVSSLAVTVPANGFQVLRLDTIPAYLKGVVTVTGGVGVIATVIQ